MSEPVEAGHGEARAGERAALEARWLELTRRDLPAAARMRGWPVRLDHCFQRILLDNACGTVWYERIAKRPAYRHAPDTILRRAVELGEEALNGEDRMWRMNDSSLRWRGKSVKTEKAFDGPPRVG